MDMYQISELTSQSINFMAVRRQNLISHAKRGIWYRHKRKRKQQTTGKDQVVHEVSLDICVSWYLGCHPYISIYHTDQFVNHVLFYALAEGMYTTARGKTTSIQSTYITYSSNWSTRNFLLWPKA